MVIPRLGVYLAKLPRTNVQRGPAKTLGFVFFFLAVKATRKIIRSDCDSNVIREQDALIDRQHLSEW